MHTNAKGLVYKFAEERAEIHRTIFEEVLEFSEVRVFKNVSKANIIGELGEIKIRADAFEKDRGNKDLLAIAIVNIGFYLDLVTYKPH